MLKMSLNEIRGQIQIYPENWKNIHTTNCYAYALGLDIVEHEICPYVYQPGTISNSSTLHQLPPYFFYQELIHGIEEDLKILDISYHEINSQDIIEESEWKMALYIKLYEKDIDDDLCSDFHFLRTNQNGAWRHKNGKGVLPNKLDDFGNRILNPETCDFIFYEYKKCYALKLNR